MSRVFAICELSGNFRSVRLTAKSGHGKCILVRQKVRVGCLVCEKKIVWACLSKFDELFLREESACIFWILKNENACRLLTRKKFVNIGNKQTKDFWEHERTHTNFLMDKNAFPMARFGCKRPRKSKTQNCHLCHILRIPCSYIGYVHIHVLQIGENGCIPRDI